MATGIRLRSVLWLALVGLAATLLVGVTATIPAAGATTFVVDNITDDDTPSACTTALGDCSLRGAVDAANSTAGEDTITFAIPAAQCPGGICRITLTEGPLELTEAATLDATTQPQNGGPQANVCATANQPSHMRIEVETVGSAPTAFVINHAAGSSVIRGFAIGTDSNLGPRVAINARSGTGHHIACNHLGLDAAGSAQFGSPPFSKLVLIDGNADSVVVGTDGDRNNDLAERNVFGSATHAIYVNANHDCRISGNYFGFTADGATSIPSGLVYVRQSSSNTLIGTNSDGVSDDLEINYLGGDAQISLDARAAPTSGNRVVGNVLGMGPTGTIAPVSLGIRLVDFDTDDTGYEISDNVVTSATATAISVNGNGSDLIIDGNLIGQTPDGIAGSVAMGMQVARSVSPQVSNNVIANASFNGFRLADTASLAPGSTGNCIIGNVVGVDNTTGSAVVFESNWWGATDGPSGSGSGSGDSASADVDYDPWLTSPPAICNTAPVTSDAAFTVAEDAAVGTTVGTVAAVDDGATLEYSIVAGDNDGVFAIDTAGAIATAAALDYETTPSFSLTVEVSDGLLSDTATVAVTVTDIFEPPAMSTFGDVPESHIFYLDIEWLAASGITKGCNPPDNDMYCPDDSVTRGQMAAFLVRGLGLTEKLDDPFSDDDGSIFEADIEKLAAAGITRGCNPPLNDMFCPGESVTRGQMAAFLVRAMGYVAGAGSDRFVDDDGSVFEADIERLAEAGVTRGCNPPTNDQFCPTKPVTRGQMAAFLRRALDTAT